MIHWTQEQKDVIWKLYTDQQITLAQIAQRYNHIGATRSAIAGLIGRINMAREKEVEAEIKRAGKGFKNPTGSKKGQPRGGYLKECRSDNKLTKEEISNIRKLRP